MPKFENEWEKDLVLSLYNYKAGGFPSCKAYFATHQVGLCRRKQAILGRIYDRTKASQLFAKGREHINFYDLVSIIMLEPALIQKPRNYVTCLFLFQFLTFLIT